MRLLNLADGTLVLDLHDRMLGRLFGKPDPPAAPDYGAAAQAQGAANIEAARVQGKMNNPTVISPYGTQRVTYGTFNEDAFNKANQSYLDALAQWNAAGGKQASQVQTGVDEQGNPIYGQGFVDLPRPMAPNYSDYGTPSDQPTITQTFSPEQQALFDQSNQTKMQLGLLGGMGAKALQGIVGKELDFSGVPAAPGSAEGTRNQAMDSIMSRVNEDTNIRRDNLNSDLVAAGVRPGSKAYDDQMRLIDRGYNDARNQAFLASGQEMTRDFQTDTQRRKDTIAEILAQRQMPLNEVTAILSGSQVQNQFAMPGYAQNANVQPAPVFGATQLTGDYATDVYNANAAQQGNLMSGLFGLGGAGLMAAGMGF